MISAVASKNTSSTVAAEQLSRTTILAGSYAVSAVVCSLPSVSRSFSHGNVQYSLRKKHLSWCLKPTLWLSGWVSTRGHSNRQQLVAEFGCKITVMTRYSSKRKRLKKEFVGRPAMPVRHFNNKAACAVKNPVVGILL